jgi:hypothetical protein
MKSETPMLIGAEPLGQRLARLSLAWPWVEIAESRMALGRQAKT